MFKEPITEITFETVENFCKEALPEGIRLDYKEDFPKDLAKTIAAFANTYGGLILLGVEETDQATPKLPIKGIALQRGLNERVTAIALRGIYPPVFPETKVCEFSSEGHNEPDRGVVVIRVQEGDNAYAIENKTKVYIRVDRQDEPYELADADRVLELAAKRKEAIENRRRMIENASRRCRNVIGFDLADEPTRTVIIAPVFPHGPLVSLEALCEMSRQSSRRLAWLFGENPKPVQGGVMCHPRHPARGDFDYTELNEQGLVFYLESLYENEREGYENSVHIGRTIMVIGTVIEYALQCYERMGFWGLAKIELVLSNVLGKRLSTDPSRAPLSPSYTCPDRDIRIEITKSISELRESYPSVVEDFVRRFTWAFGCQLHPEVIQEHVKSTLTKL